MEIIKNKKYIKYARYEAEWICPNCGCKNTQRNILTDRWKCFKCKKYFLRKKQKD